MARREALERIKSEEERRQVEDKLQAEALLQQMEELKVKEMEVRACPQPRGPSWLLVVAKWPFRKLL